jgi:hypothetical protein
MWSSAGYRVQSSKRSNISTLQRSSPIR